MVFALDTTLSFPDPHLGEPDGLLAVGGDLSVDRMLLAYSYGIFPWYSFRYNREILWYCPMQRFVIFPSEVHVSHSMRSLMSRGTYHVTFNQDFDEVIRRCSRLRIKEDGAWLGVDMVKAYRKMHEQGFAASVEVWQSDRLVGGLYGVTIGRCFFGESMFSLVPSASKLALIHLAHYMNENGGLIIDCQFETPHLRSMGGRFIAYDDYLKIIQQE